MKYYKVTYHAYNYYLMDPNLLKPLVEDVDSHQLASDMFELNAETG